MLKIKTFFSYIRVTPTTYRNIKMSTFPENFNPVIKTKDDMQMILVVLFLLFIIGTKCYMIITTQGKGEKYTTTKSAPSFSYPQLSFKNQSHQ